MSYKLSATLSGHTQDVRCVASSSSGSRILSSSRDRTARSWVHRNDSGWTAAATYAGAHENFVNAVASLQLRDGREMVVTGSGDATILLWPLDGSQPEPEKVLVGHAGNVCALNASNDNDNDALQGMLASGSWDGTAKIWDLSDPSSPTSSEPVYTLEGATQAVWAVLLLPTSTRGSIHCLTASADKLIRLYHNASHVATFKGHEQPVRALSLVPPAAVGEQGIFASAGNDGLVKIWNWTQGSASELRTLQGHDSFVYSLATALDGTLASSGEDRTVRVWDKLTGDLKQIITIPAISIWSVAFVAGTDDIIVGSSDSLVRVFTRDPARFAPADELAALDEAVSSSTLNASQVVGDVKKSDLASDDTLAARQGKKEGEIAMVKNAAGGVEAYQWSAADGKWVKVGQVVDAVGSGRKQLYEGKEYDFVFDVDVSEGQPPLKLPYNVTQNPYEAAQLFLTRNELPPSYVDQVVQFIEKNTAGATLGSGGNLDPYTGASSYKSTPSTNAPKPQGQNGTMGNGFSGDPWGPSSAGAGANAAPAKARLLPLTTPLTFPQANLAAIQKKLLDFNEALSENPTTSTEFPLDASSMTTLESSIASLQAASSSSPFSAPAELLAILGRLLEWPSASRFPALDLVRIVALHDSTGAAAASLLFPLLANLSPDPAAAQKENETNALLATRAIANAFSGAGGRKAMGHAAAEALETLSVVGTAGLNKLGKTALATVALNFSILAVQGSVPSDSIGSLVELIQQLLQDTESETVYRALVAFGNVAHASRINKQSLDASTAKNVKQHAQALAAGTGEQRIKEIVREIEQKL